MVLPKKGTGKVLEERVQSSNQGAPTHMGGKYLRADLWWAHKSEFACAVDQERVLNQDSGKFERIFELVCENSEQHGFKLTKDTVEFF